MSARVIGAPMEQALAPGECERMRRFLRTLVLAADRCREVGCRPDIGAAMRAWSDRPGGGPVPDP